MTFLLDDTLRFGSSRIVKKIEILLVSATALLLGSSLYAGDSRVWTSRKGTTLEGELLKADTASVTIVDKTGRTLPPIKMEDLSIADREYIVRYSKVDPKILALGEPGEPEKEYKVDEKTFVKDKENKFTLGDANYEILRTEHFLIASSGEVRGNVFGEAAERIWHGMAFQHMDFRRDWGDQRMLIIADADKKTHAAAGKWYFQFLKDSGKADDAGVAAAQWDQGNINNNFLISPEIATKFAIKPLARYFSVVEPAGYKKSLSPGLIHAIAHMMLERQIGGFSPTGMKGSNVMIDGHSYYKEYSLTGEIATSMVVTSGTDNLTNQNHEGSRENWPKVLKAAVKKGTMKLSLPTALSWQVGNYNAENMPAVMSLSYYLQSTNLRLSYYANLVQRMASGHAVPEPEEIAKIYGFDSVAAFDADWTAFVLSTSFK